MNNRIVSVACVCCCLMMAIQAHAEGLRTLIKVGKSQDEMIRILNDETKTYGEIMEAIKAGRIEEGGSGEEIRKRYGAPVLAVDEGNGVSKWIYKPGYASYFDKEKVYIFVDKNGTVQSIRVFTKQ